MAMLDRATLSRAGGSLAMSSFAASMRNLGFAVRAGAPRRSHASSFFMRFWRFDSMVAAIWSRSTRCRMYAAYPPSNGSMSRSCTSHVAVQISSRNHRSWVTTTSPPAFDDQRRLRWPASQVMPSTSRWLVGSSRKMMSWSPMSSAARATRRRWPPDRSPTRASHGRSAMRPAITSRTLGSPAQTCSSMSPMTVWWTVLVPSSSSAWSSMARVTPPRRVTRPESGSRRPASIRSRVDLPSPLRPTMPMRSPSSRPMVSLSKMTRVGNSRCSASAPRRCATA